MVFRSNMAGQVRFLNRGSVLGFEAAREALENSNIDLAAIPRERRSLFIASGDLTKVGYEFMHPAIKDATKHAEKGTDFSVLNKSTMDKVNPFFLLESISNNLFSFLSAVFEFMGPNTSLASLSPCGAHALELACRKIRSGRGGCSACRRVWMLDHGNPHVRNGRTRDSVQVQAWCGFIQAA